MSTELTIKLSCIIDKMQIKDEIIKIDAKTEKEVGNIVITLIICNLHKAADDVYEFVAMYKGISIEEAKKANVIEILKEVVNNPGVKDFLA